MGAGKKPQSSSDGYMNVAHLHQALEKRAIKGAGFSISSQVINYGIQTVGTIILARLLSPDLFGLVAMVETVSLLLQNFGFNGITEAVVQREDLTHVQLSKLFWIYMAMILALTVGFILSAPLLVWFFHEPQLSRITIAMALIIPLSGLATCHIALLTRNMEFQRIALIQVISVLLSTAAAIIMAFQGMGYWALVLRRIAMQFLIAALAWILCRWRPSGLARGVRVAPILRFALRTYMTFLVDYARKSVDKILIGKILGKTSLGHYDRAYQLAGVLPNQLSASLSGVSLAAMSRLKDSREKYIDLFAKNLSVIAFVAFPASVLLTLVGKNLIVLLIGGKWIEAGKIFSALGPSIGVVVVYYAIYWLHFSLGRADRLLKWSTFTLAVSLVAYTLGIQFGSIGVAVAYSFLFYALLIPALCYAGKPMDIKAAFFLSILWKYWFSAFLAAGIWMAVLHLLGPITLAYDHLGLLGKITATALAYGASYMSLILALFKGPGPLISLASVVRRFFTRGPMP